MKVMFNGEPLQVFEAYSLADVLLEQAVKNGFNLTASVAAVNLTFVHRDSYSEYQLKDGDDIELLTAVVGG
jgi:thiamine biosynthesis protein ThiS